MVSASKFWPVTAAPGSTPASGATVATTTIVASATGARLMESTEFWLLMMVAVALNATIPGEVTVTFTFPGRSWGTRK